MHCIRSQRYTDIETTNYRFTFLENFLNRVGHGHFNRWSLLKVCDSYFPQFNLKTMLIKCLYEVRSAQKRRKYHRCATLTKQPWCGLTPNQMGTSSPLFKYVLLHFTLMFNSLTLTFTISLSLSHSLSLSLSLSFSFSHKHNLSLSRLHVFFSNKPYN